MAAELFGGRTVEQWCVDDPIVDALASLRETSWFNPRLLPTGQALAGVGLSAADIADSAARLRRFAPYLEKAFPQTVRTGGILESPLVGIANMQRALASRHGREIPGRLWAKLDSELPISGSIKARGGIYEVLKHAEDLALEHGLLTPGDDYAVLASAPFREFFGRYKVAVGSTGNLGLSIGIISAVLGFQVSVHMSADARRWKKDLLRSHGVAVVEYESDYSTAVAAGRRQAEADPTTYFVDDENSTDLFLGYAVAARRLAGQLQSLDIEVDAEHPLFVYLPCGVGGGPGGVSFGLKSEFGDAVHCIFAEPTHSPCMFLGVKTGLHDAVSVQDFDIDNVTSADGLAVGRPSGFVGRRMERLIDGFYTVGDDELHRLIALLHRSEGIDIEPSAAAGLPGALRVLEDGEYLARIGVTETSLRNATHIAWCTGGSMVPCQEMDGYIGVGESLLDGETGAGLRSATRQ
ncbi:D-serine ammonia-lyase [Actinomycetaceae bacterium L2_0104]